MTPVPAPATLPIVAVSGWRHALLALHAIVGREVFKFLRQYGRLLSALAAIGRVYVGPASGVMVEAFGWPVFFLWSIAAAAPGLLLLAWLKKDVDKLPGAMP